MLGRVFVLRTIAAPDMATGQAKPQMHPGVSHRKTFFTAFRSVWRNVFFGISQMLAWCIHTGSASDE